MAEISPRPPLPLRPALALAVGTGVLYFMGFAGTDIWPASLVAMAPLTIAIQRQTPRRALVLGAVSGLTMNLCGFYWLLGMLQTFSGFPTIVCAFIMVALCTYQGGRIGFFGWLYGRASARGWPWVPALFAAFATSELLWPLLFPWYFAASVHQVPALTQLAELGGPYIVGLVLLAPSIALAELWLSRQAGRPFHRLTVALGFAAPVACALYGAVRVAEVDAAVEQAPSVHVGLVQGNQPLVGSHTDHVEGLRRQLAISDDLRKKGADLLVFSESALVFGLPETELDTYLRRLLAPGLNLPALIGTTIVRQAEPHPLVFNSAVATDSTGHVVGRYDKHFLLMFGEYLPFGEAFPILYDWSPNSGHLQQGSSIEAVSLAGHPVTVLVCYEDIIPSFVNSAVAKGHPEMLVNMTNDAWFGNTTEPWIHLALAQIRAVEHRRYLLRATNAGVSSIVDPVGRVVAHGGTFTAEGVDAVAHWMKGNRTGYEIWGDAPFWILALASAWMATFSRAATMARLRRTKQSSAVDLEGPPGPV